MSSSSGGREGVAARTPVELGVLFRICRPDRERSSRPAPYRGSTQVTPSGAVKRSGRWRLDLDTRIVTFVARSAGPAWRQSGRPRSFARPGRSVRSVKVVARAGCGWRSTAASCWVAVSARGVRAVLTRTNAPLLRCARHGDRQRARLPGLTGPHPRYRSTELVAELAAGSCRRINRWQSGHPRIAGRTVFRVRAEQEHLAPVRAGARTGVRVGPGRQRRNP